MELRALFNDKEFLKNLFKLALPIAFQNLILSSLNLVDTIIIGGLGDASIAGVGIANQFFFLLNLVLFGIVSGSSIFTAQYFGDNDIPNIKKVLGISLVTSGTAASIFAILGFFFNKEIINIFSKDPLVISIGSSYLKIIVFSYVVTAITFSYSFVLRSIGQVKLPMIISIIALTVNTVLNYVLVYGLFGMPKLGTNGSALATLIARAIEMLLMVSVVYYKKLIIAAKLKELLNLSFDFIKRFFKVTTPVILNESIWSLGVSMYAVAYARMGTEVIASTNIAATVERITWVIFMGLGNACAVMIGNKIGEGNEDEAFLLAKRFIILCPVLAILAGFLVFLNSGFILSVYKISPTVYTNAHNILTVFSIFIVAKVINYISVIGIFRSGGDTKFSLLLDTGGVWLIGVPLAFIGGLVLKLPIHIVYILIYVEEVVKLMFCIPRILSKKWINNLTEAN